MNVLVITKENFEQEVINSEKTVLLDFWASWCGPCRMVSPIIDEIAGERPEIKVGKVNVDEQPELAQKFQATEFDRIFSEKSPQSAFAVRLRGKPIFTCDTLMNWIS